MNKGYVVVNESGVKLNWSNPWGDGDVLVQNADGDYTIFPSEEEAVQALSDTCDYEWKNSLYWETEKWKVVPFEAVE